MEEGKQSLPNEISAVLIRWYETHRRELPWRETTDPYRIWISEIILQQTRVAQGLESVSYTHLDVYKRQVRY